MMTASARLRRALLVTTAVAALCATGTASGQNGGGSGGGLASIQPPALEEWLGYLASDELQGREVYSEGLGLAASYIVDHLREWGVAPAANGSYFQTVKVVGVNNSGRSAVTVEVNGQTRTFTDGDGVTFPRHVGGGRTITSADVYFAGYGLELPSAGHDDYEGVTVQDRVVVWLGAAGPREAGQGGRRALAARSRRAVGKGALAVIGPPMPDRYGRGADGRGRRGAADFTTVQRYDLPVPPVVTADDEFFEFLFTGAEVPYAQLAVLAGKQAPLPRFALKGAKVTFTVAPEYSVATTRLSRNIVGMVEGSDPALKDTYVVFGAHYDHIGYQETAAPRTAGAENPGDCTGQTRPEPRPGDTINNGADDDGSGTVALMAIARAFALGPRPRRSVVFIWHTAEESGLQGSRYNADYPVVPNEKIIAKLNMDMIGRNRCDRPSESNTVYLVGSDRISTELHNLSEDVNASLASPMTLDYELNDPADPLALYTRSDHYSYAAKGIPVIFYTTGLHRDYHYVTDEIDRIEFEKMTRVARLVYATGERLANTDRPPVRDNRGPRAGRGSRGKLH